jgi:hypothetical protein
MIHEAECRLTLSPTLNAKAGRILDAASHVEWRAEMPVTPRQLGGQEIRLVVKGENAALLMKILAAIKQPGADVESLVAALKGLHESSNPDPDTGPDGERPA